MTAKELIGTPSSILEKQPFYRGCKEINLSIDYSPDFVGTEYLAELPKGKYVRVNQDKFLQELDPMCHIVHFDQTIPDIAVQKTGKTYLRQKSQRLAFNFQEIIASKRLQYLCGKATKFTLCNFKPTEKHTEMFVKARETWVSKNMDVWRYKLMDSVYKTGDGAILHYLKPKGGKTQYKHRLLSFADGYVLLPHYDDNGEMLLFGIYYKSEGGEVIDVYDETFFYKFSKSGEKGEWALESAPLEHGFNQIPVTYCRDTVAWNSIQNVIEIYEILYNIYTIVQKKFGNSLLWVRGNYDAKTKKQGWAVVLNSSSLDANADAKVLSPAEPVGMQNLLADLKKHIQLGSFVVLLQPEEVKISGDISGIAVKLIMSSAYEKAMQDALKFDYVIDNMMSLFLEGIVKEDSSMAEVSSIIIRGEFEAWMPQSETEIINNLNMSMTSGSLSRETALEVHPYSKPDEHERYAGEQAEKEEREKEKEIIKTESQVAASVAANNAAEKTSNKT